MGPLAGYRIVEMAGIGPGPFCGMLFADMGADVVRIDPPGFEEVALLLPETTRGKRCAALDLRDDGYEPERCAVATKTLIEQEHVFAMIGGVGTLAVVLLWMAWFPDLRRIDGLGDAGEGSGTVEVFVSGRPGALPPSAEAFDAGRLLGAIKA